MQNNFSSPNQKFSLKKLMIQNKIVSLDALTGLNYSIDLALANKCLK